MKWVGLRWDKAGRAGSAYSLYRGETCNVPLVASGEQLLKGGVPFRIHGMGIHAQQYGSYLCSQTKAEVDKLLDQLAAAGINLVSVMSFDRPTGAVPSGDLAGRPSSCWTTSAATAYWDQFWSGSGDVAGFDYFLDGCKRRGIYLALRFFDWDSVFTQFNALTPPNSSANNSWQGLWHSDGSNGTANLMGMVQAHIAAFVNHVNTVNGIRLGDDPTLAIINPLNEVGYYVAYFGTTNTSSPTSRTFDRMVFAGGAVNAAYVHDLDARFVAWHTAVYGAGPTWNNGTPTTVLPCFAYSGAPGASINARPGPNVPFRANWTTDSSGTATQYTERQRVAEFWETLCGNFHAAMKAYIKGIAPNVLYTAEQGGYALQSAQAQSDILDTHSYHYPTNGVQANGNTQLDTAVTLAWSGGTLTVTAVNPDGTHALVVGQPIRVVADAAYGPQATTFKWQPGRAFSVNMFCVTDDNRVYKCTTGGTTATNDAGPTGTGTGIADGSCVWSRVWSEVVTITTVINANSFSGASSDPGTTSGLAVMPGLGANYSTLHSNPATDATTTIIPANLLGTLQDVAFSGSGSGDNTTLGGIYTAVFRRGNTLADKPRYCSEMGMQGLSPIAHVQHPILYNIYDLLQGGNGTTWFAIVNGSPIQQAGDHTLQSHGTSLLLMELLTLINRYGGVPALSGLDKTVVTLDDLYKHHAYRTTASFPGGGYANAPGWVHFVGSLELAGEDGQYTSFTDERLRYAIGGATAKTDKTHASPAAADATFGGLTDANACRAYLHRNTGYLTIETPTLSLAVGRIPGPGLGPGTAGSAALTRMTIERPADAARHWYGAVAWVSEDGSALGALGGRSRIYAMCYPRQEDQQFAAVRRNSDTDAHFATLDGGYGEYTPSDNILPGVVMPEGLRLKLAVSGGSQRARIIERYGTQREHPAFTASGWMTLYPTAPLLVLSNSGTPSEAPSGGEQGLDFQSPDNSGYLSLHSIGV